MYGDNKFGNIFPTRHGQATGSANERQILSGLGGSSGYRKRFQTNNDGSVTMVTTKNGSPEFVTTPAVVEEGMLLSITLALSHNEDHVAEVDAGIDFSVDYDSAQTRRWVYRLGLKSPFSSAAMVDYSVDTTRLIGGENFYTEFGTADGAWIWKDNQGARTTTTAGGKYGPASVPLLMYGGRIVTNGGSSTAYTYAEDNYPFYFRWFSTIVNKESVFRFGSWSYSMSSVMSAIEQYDPDYTRVPPTPDSGPITLSGMNSGGAWLVEDGGVVKFVFYASEPAFDPIHEYQALLGLYSLSVDGLAPVAAPELAPLAAFPLVATNYSRIEIGPRGFGDDFIILGNNVDSVTRKGDVIPNPGFAYSLSAVYGWGFFEPNVMQLKRLSDGVFVGAKLNLETLPGISSDPQALAALAQTVAPYHWQVSGSAIAKQGPIDAGDGWVMDIMAISFTYDSKDGVDVTSTWDVS